MPARVSLILLGFAAVTSAAGPPLLLEDSLQGSLGRAWSWVREDRAAWRVTETGLQIRVLPGNMWGAANDARNVLLHPAPATEGRALEITVEVENDPTEQYEQVDLVWYYDDSNMVKIGQEMVDGQLSLVMGREEHDRTQTLAIIPLATKRVVLRLQVGPTTIDGSFRPGDATEWTRAGSCPLPAGSDAPARISLQAYQGPAEAVHWARFRNLRVAAIPSGGS